MRGAVHGLHGRVGEELRFVFLRVSLSEFSIHFFGANRVAFHLYRFPTVAIEGTAILLV
jgi:hypothetical protein